VESQTLNLQPVDKLTFPEKHPRDWLTAFLIFSFSALHFSFFYSYTLMNGDEGIILQGAQRILRGEVLYRDFFAFFTPGSYYWIAFFFKVFGSSIGVGRAVLLIEGALLSVLTYLLARRVCSRWSAFLASALVTLTGLPNRFLVLHNWDSTLWAFLTMYCAVIYLQNPRRLWLFAAGLFAAVTCLFEQSKGAGIVLGVGLAAIILVTSAGEMRSLTNLRLVAAFIVGFALPLLFTFVYFGMHHALFQMFQDWLWPLRNYSAANRTSYGFVTLSPSDRADVYSEPWPSRLFVMLITGPWFIIPALPIFGAGVLLYWVQKWRASRTESARAYYIVISASVVGLLLSIFGTGRPDFTHLVYISPILCVILAWIIDGQMWPSIVRRVMPVVVFILVLSCLGFGLSLLSQPLNAVHTLHTRRGTLRSVKPDEVVDYVQKNVRAGETILVYPYLPLYYYLTGTFSPSRYEYLQPGLHTPEQFQELARAVEADQTQMILFEPSFGEKAPTAFPATSTEILNGKDPMADYISSHYRKCTDLTSQNFWHFAVMLRKDLACP
jgi:4-amino-4-deoxy-L-arabinose transferase-like glycosyltransferase